MLRPALLLLLAALPAAAPAAPLVTADRAMNNYQQAFATTEELDCPRGAGEEEIVVCARRPDRPDPYRLPIPADPVPGERTRLTAGEAPGATLNPEPCIRLCQSGVGVDLEKAIKIVKGIGRLIEGDD